MKKRLNNENTSRPPSHIVFFLAFFRFIYPVMQLFLAMHWDDSRGNTPPTPSVAADPRSGT